MCCVLCLVCCVLFAVFCLLCDVCCQLFVDRCLLTNVCCMEVLFVACWLMFSVRRVDCLLRVVC